MLKKSVLELTHPCFGKIRFNSKFAKVLELKPFWELSQKSQLGTKSLSKQFVNAKHTRFLHSIGVYYLTSTLLKTCEEKFSNYIEITQQDKEILQLAALGHDIGHVAFSHSLEIDNMPTHEERTIELFKKFSNEINEIFGYDIVSNVIQVYKNNIVIKKKGNDYQMDESLDILFIFSSLLVGSIDCDRMEYIITDRYMTTGEKLDFRPIFDYITIVLLNNSPTVGFERSAISLIESLLTNRFEQYEQIYYDEDSTLIEMALKQYVSVLHWSWDKIVSSTEYEILTELNTILSSFKSDPTVLYRLAQIILLGNRENILFKKFTSDSEYHYFLDKISSITGAVDNVSWIQTCQKTNCIYTPSKNRVYIKDDDGVVKDITEVSSKITDLRIHYFYVMIDIDDVYGIDPIVRQNLISLFHDNPVEIEKKFVLNDTSFSEVFSAMEYKEIFIKIETIPGVSLGNIKKVTNNDQYYIPLTSLPEGTAMRLRITDKECSYYIKFPTDDGTSITKRDEQRFPNCSSLEEFLVLAEKAISLKWNCLSKNSLAVKQGVFITTNRVKVPVYIFDSIIELSYDISTYEYEGNIAKDFMLECELKHGDDLALWYLAKFIKKFGLVETNQSKETRAKIALTLDE